MENRANQDWRMRGVQLGYVLGLSLIIAAIIYFFASNWPGFDKSIKIILSVSLMIFFYVVSFLLGTIVKRHPFLSRFFLLIGCLSFGVGVALLGQIYNSHADSYMLFLIWAIPSLLLSYVTKYQPFYVLSYGLLHLALWFFLFPSSGFQYVPETFSKWVFLTVAILNGLLYLAIERKWFVTKPLQFLSFIMLHVLLLSLTMEELFAPFNMFVSFLYIGIVLYLYFYILKKHFHKGFLVLLGLGSIAFVIIKFVEFIIYIGSEYIFLFTFILPFIIVGLVLYGLRKWRTQQKGENQSFLKRFIIAVTTAIASIIAASSLYGISILIMDDFSFTFFVFIAAGFILLTKLNEKWDSIIRYTLLFTAFITGIPAAIYSNELIGFLFVGLLLYAFWVFRSTGIRYITYLSIMIILVGLLGELISTAELVAVVIVFINLVVFIGTRWIKNDGKLLEILATNSLFYGLLAFFILTFLIEDLRFLYYLTNGLYFAFTTSFVLFTLRRNHTLHHRIVLAFWFAYIMYKYYDLVWGLLHKSITFLITGLLIIVIARRFDTVREMTRESVSRARIVAILIIVAIQLVILGLQVGKSERLLANGEMIKLELAPVDPRSLLQGDYLVLRYNISSLKLDGGYWNKRVFIGLNKDENGVYEYSGEHVIGKNVPEALVNKADVWITGRLKGYQNIEYGIENYFIQEGTGLDLEGKMKYAYVKVAENGDALLVKLSEK